ncbi:ribonuclease H-like domain-containing protein, partial [Tanacetum coccineum]
NIVRCMWLFRHKFHADGTLSRYKARLVANGSTQLEGVDVDETFSPVVKPGTIQTVLTTGFRNSTYPDHVCLSHWSLYGLKQAFRAWFQRHGMDTTYLLLYVDDIVLTASSQHLLRQIIASLHQEFSMTNMGSLNYFLGSTVTRDSSEMFLSERKYVVEILKREHMVNCNYSRTSVDTESKLREDGDLISDPTLYQSLAGYLQCLIFTRSDTSYALHLICLYMHDPREPHSRLLRGFCSMYESSKRQPTLSHSSVEVEYRGVANVVAETCWLRNLLRELHTPLSSATLVYCDNVSAVYLSCNPVQHQRTKHIEIDIHFVRDLVAVGLTMVIWDNRNRGGLDFGAHDSVLSHSITKAVFEGVR